jgi:cysteine desulfurase
MLPFLRDPNREPPSTQGIREAFGARSGDAFWLTSGGAEAAGWVAYALYDQAMRETGRTHLLVPATERGGIKKALEGMERLGCVCQTVPVDARGHMTASSLEESLRPRSILFSLSWADPLTGVIQPVADLARVCRERGVYSHVDASMALGKVFFRFEDLGVDFLSFDGPLVGGPRGSGGLFVRQGLKVRPFFPDPYPPDPAALAGLDAAVRGAVEAFDHCGTETARLRDRLERHLVAGIPNARVLFGGVDRLPHCTVVAFPGVAAEALSYRLERRHVHVCPVVCEGEGLLAHSALSLSLADETCEEEVDRAAGCIVEAVRALKPLSVGLSDAI